MKFPSYISVIHWIRTSFWNRLRMKPIFDDGGELMYVFGIQNVIEAVDVRPEPIFDKIVD